MKKNNNFFMTRFFLDEKNRSSMDGLEAEISKGLEYGFSPRGAWLKAR